MKKPVKIITVGYAASLCGDTVDVFTSSKSKYKVSPFKIVTLKDDAWELYCQYYKITIESITKQEAIDLEATL